VGAGKHIKGGGEERRRESRLVLIMKEWATTKW